MPVGREAMGLGSSYGLAINGTDRRRRPRTLFEESSAGYDRRDSHIAMSHVNEESGNI